MFSRKMILSLVGALILIWMAFFLPPLFELTLAQQRTLLLLVLSILLWTTHLIQTGISSLFVIGLAMAWGVAEDFSGAIQGFLSSTIYFILVVALISSTMTKVGLDQRIASFIVRMSHGNIRRVALSFFVATLVLPIIIPSGNARVQMFLPLVEQIGRKYAPESGIPFQRFTIWTLGGINQFSTIIVLSGGGLAVLASQLVAELNIRVTWLNWFLFMAPPIWLSCLLTGMVMWHYWNIRDGAIPWTEPSMAAISERAIEPSSSIKVWIVIGMLVTLIAAWIIAPIFHIPLILPPLLFLGILALPGINLLSNHDIRTYDWENFLLLGTALSLAFIIEQNGTAHWITGRILSWMGQHLPPWTYLFILMGIILVIRVLFTSPAASLPVMYPLVKSFAEWVGLEPVHSLFFAIFLSTATMLLPVHSPIMYMAYKSGHIPMGEHVTISVVQLFVAMLVGMASFWFYWPLVISMV